MSLGKVYSHSKISVYCVIIMIAFLVSFLSFASPADAAQGVVLSTSFPGTSATPGESITFPLKIKNNSSVKQFVELSVTSQPDKWHTTLKGNNRIIHQVLTEANGETFFELLVKIPEEALPGEYSINVAARNNNGYSLDNLTLKIKIADTEVSNDLLKANYAELQGPADATFNFKINLVNNGNNEQLYSLGAQVQDGWQVSFKPSFEDQQVASIAVKPGESKSLDVTVKPPVNVIAGEYTIPILAVSPASRITEELKVIITGTYKLEFSTPTGKLSTDIVAGREKKVNMQVKNSGSAILNNITFSANTPVDWAVSFEPENIDALKPGETRQVTATISAADKAIVGDYLVSMTATTQVVRSIADMRVTVKTSTLWGIVGLLIIIAVLYVIYRAFQKYGRR